MVADICRCVAWFLWPIDVKCPHHVAPKSIGMLSSSRGVSPGYGTVGRRHERDGCSGSTGQQKIQRHQRLPQVVQNLSSSRPRRDLWGRARSPWPMLACLCASLVLKYVLGSSEKSGGLNSLNTWVMYGHVWCRVQRSTHDSHGLSLSFWQSLIE